MFLSLQHHFQVTDRLCKPMSSIIMWSLETVGQIVTKGIQKTEMLTNGYYDTFYNVTGDDVININK